MEVDIARAHVLLARSRCRTRRSRNNDLLCDPAYWSADLSGIVSILHVTVRVTARITHYYFSPKTQVITASSSFPDPLNLQHLLLDGLDALVTSAGAHLFEIGERLEPTTKPGA